MVPFFVSNGERIALNVEVQETCAPAVEECQAGKLIQLKHSYLPINLILDSVGQVYLRAVGKDIASSYPLVYAHELQKQRCLSSLYWFPHRSQDEGIIRVGFVDF